ncbi:hypothetical protein HY463_00765 [Candidatus Peregrinibacteria bacterium]|nr:hypothetical protein [Candidatus Peregrinibacteria bacterium]
MFKPDRTLDEAIELLGDPQDGVQEEIKPDDEDFTELGRLFQAQTEHAVETNGSTDVIDRILGRPIFQRITAGIPSTPSANFFAFDQPDSRLHEPYEAVQNAFDANNNNSIMVSAATSATGTLFVVAQHGTGFDVDGIVEKKPQSFFDADGNFTGMTGGNGMFSLGKSRHWQVSYQYAGDRFLTIMYCDNPNKKPEAPHERRARLLNWLLEAIALEYPAWREPLSALATNEEKVAFVKESHALLPTTSISLRKLIKQLN